MALEFLLTFGAFQAYYEQVLLRNQSSFKIFWISTICAFILLSAGIGTGSLYDYEYYKALSLLSSLLQVFDLMMVAQFTQYWQLFLS